jgi:hypothetical protein
MKSYQIMAKMAKEKQRIESVMKSESGVKAKAGQRNIASEMASISKWPHGINGGERKPIMASNNQWQQQHLSNGESIMSQWHQLSEEEIIFGGERRINEK